MSRFATGMRCGEFEYVPFQNQMECVGPVEIWLNKLVDCAKKGVSREFKDGVDTYDDKPRTKWIFDFSMQNTLLVSQVSFLFITSLFVTYVHGCSYVRRFNQGSWRVNELDIDSRPGRDEFLHLCPDLELEPHGHSFQKTHKWFDILKSRLHLLSKLMQHSTL